VSVQVPIFTGGQREIDLLTANRQTEQTRLDRERTANTVAADAKQAWLTVRTLQQTIKAPHDQVVTPEQAYHELQNQYRAGTATRTRNPVINVTVGSQISGNISELHADFNSPVTRDMVVAMLDPSTYRATVHQCQGDLAQVQAALELAQLTAKRKKELVEQKA